MKIGWRRGKTPEGFGGGEYDQNSLYLCMTISKNI